MTYLRHNFSFGIGYGNYHNIVSQLTYYSTSKSMYMNAPTATESGFLTFLIEGGMVGLILNLLLVFNIFKDISRFNTEKNLTNSVTVTIFICTITLIVSNIFQDNLNFTYWFFLGSCIALLKNKFGSEENEYFNNK